MKFLLSFSALMLLSINANADTIISCGASEGHAYFLQQGLVGAKDAGWRKDEISPGAFSLVRNGDKLDILYKDITGMYSATAEGGKVTLVGITDPNITVLVNYDGVTVELYTFDMKSRVAVWSQHKYGAPINKASTFSAKC